MAHEPGSHQDRRLLSAPDRAAPRRAWPLRQPLRSRNPTCRRRVVHGRPGLSIAHPTAWSDPWIALPAAAQGRAQAGAMSRGGRLRRMRRHAAGLAHVSPVGGRGAERGEPGVRVHSEGLCARLSVASGELSGGILRQRGPFAVARGGYALERSGARNPVAAPLLHDLAPRCRMAHARTMKLLVLGNTGQLGAELLAQAPALRVEATGLGREDLDVTEPGAVDSVLDSIAPDVVINATAYHVLPDCDRFPERAFATNAIAVKAMAEACHGRDVEFVTYSTDYVFDGLKGSPYFEVDAPNPLQTYGVSKYAGELLARLGHPDTIVIRTCGLYGGETGSRSKRGNFVLSVLRESESESQLEVSSEQIVNPTYAGDLAAATLALLAARPVC